MKTTMIISVDGARYPVVGNPRRMGRYYAAVVSTPGGERVAVKCCGDWTCAGTWTWHPASERPEPATVNRVIC